MRIAIFTDTYKPDANGCAQSVEVLANNLIQMNQEVYIFCPGNSLSVQKEGHVIRIPGLEVKKLYGYKIAQPIHPLLLNEISNLKLDIIHAETEFGVGTLANLVSHYLNIPRVRTYHTDYVDYTHYFIPENLGIIYDGAKRLVTLYNKFYGDHCLRLMTPSEKTKKGLLQANIKTEIEVVPNGIELDRFDFNNTNPNRIKEIRDSLNIKNDEKLLIYVGRIAEEKRVDLIIRTFEEVKKNKLKIKLVIVGLGTAYDKLIELTKTLGLNDYVKFTGKIEPDNVPEYYHASDCFISASTSETQGLTYIEALASSLPVIVAYDEVLIDLVKEGYNGFFFNDEKSCYEAILKFNSLSNGDLKAMKENAYNSSRIYDAKKFAKDTLKIYQDVIEEFKTSYRIIRTKLKNDVVKIYLINKMNEATDIVLSIDDYLKYGFRKDSLVKSKIVNDLKDKELMVLAYVNSLKKLSIKDYSIKQMKDSLLRKYELSDEQLSCIINKLLDMNLLNDERYTSSRIDFLRKATLSKKAIYSKLMKEGISRNLIDSLYVSEDDDDINNARKKAQKYFNSIKGKSLNAKKRLITTKLINDGYSVENSKMVVNELDFSKDLLKESDLLKVEAEKAYNRYHNKYDGYELRNHIFNSLASKGFDLEDIYAVINEMEY